MAADKGKAGATLIGTSVGFGIGFLIAQQGCGTGNWIPMALFGGALFAILGAILGALLG